MLRGRFLGLSIYPLGIALLPALVIPYQWLGINSTDQKGLIAALCLGVALLFFARQLFTTEYKLPTFPLVAYFAIALAVVVVLSALINEISFTKFFGIGFEMGTGGSFILFAAAVLYGSIMDRAEMRRHYQWYVSVLFAIVIMGVTLSFINLDDLSSLPVEWPGPPFLLVLGVILAVLLGEEAAGKRNFLGYLLVSSVFASVFFFIYHPLAAMLGCGILSLFLIIKLLHMRVRQLTTVPLLSFLSVVFFALLVVFGYQGPFALPIDARPSIELTEAVGVQALNTSISATLLGSGPATWSGVWELYRPLDSTSVFNIYKPTEHIFTFSESYSSVLTWFITLGFLGVGCYLFCFLSLLFGVGETVLRGRASVLQEPIFLISTLVALFGLLLATLYTIGIIVFLLSGVACGFCGTLLSRERQSTTVSAPARLVMGGVVLFLGIFLVLVASVQVAAGALQGHAVVANHQKNFAVAANLSNRAATIWPLSEYAQDASRRLAILLQRGPEVGVPLNSTSYNAQRARALARAAVVADPKDFSAWLNEGAVLTTVLQNDSLNWEKEARQSLLRAKELAPARSEVSLAQAALSVALRDFSEAKRHLDTALQLKGEPLLVQQLKLRMQLVATSEASSTIR